MTAVLNLKSLHMRTAKTSDGSKSRFTFALLHSIIKQFLEGNATGRIPSQTVSVHKCVLR